MCQSRCISASSWSSSLFVIQSFSAVLANASLQWVLFHSFTKLKHLRVASRAITGCLSSSPIPLLSKASLPPLRVTLTHFTLLSYERALRLPITFPISGLARLRVKPRLSRSSRRVFESTHPLMPSPKEVSTLKTLALFSSLFFITSNFLAFLAGTVFYLLLSGYNGFLRT